MELSNYPSNTITKHLYVNSNNTIYYISMHTSVSLKTAATTELKQEAPCHLHIPQLTSLRQRVLTSQYDVS